MNTLPFSCSEVRALLADRLDDLLEPAESARVDAHVAACPACAAVLASRSHARSVLMTAWDVEAPRKGLAEGARVLFVARATPGPWRRLALVASHAGALAAGVLLTLALYRVPTGTAPDEAPSSQGLPSNGAVAAATPAAPAPTATFHEPRRIR